MPYPFECQIRNLLEWAPETIANQTAEFISSLNPVAHVVVEQAPPEIAKYIINGR